MIDGVVYLPLDPDDVVSGCASVPVTVRWFDGGSLMKTTKCRVFAGSVGIEPGEHHALGVRLEGVPEPPPEFPDEVKGGKVIVDGVEYAKHDWERPETRAERRNRFVQNLHLHEKGLPSGSDGFDAVRPRIGWFMIEDDKA
jgi:hypothetical protein